MPCCLLLLGGQLVAYIAAFLAGKIEACPDNKMRYNRVTEEGFYRATLGRPICLLTK